jgi:hypothetical protein
MPRGAELSSQTRDTYGERYSFWNFTAYKKYGTIECRILPAFDRPDHLLDTMQLILWVLDKHLHYTWNKNKELKGTFAEATLPFAGKNIVESEKIPLKYQGVEDTVCNSNTDSGLQRMLRNRGYALRRVSNHARFEVEYNSDIETGV